MNVSTKNVFPEVVYFKIVCTKCYKWQQCDKALCIYSALSATCLVNFSGRQEKDFHFLLKRYTRHCRILRSHPITEEEGLGKYHKDQPSNVQVLNNGNNEGESNTAVF